MAIHHFRRTAVERQPARQQLDVTDGERILIGKRRRAAVKRLRRGVGGAEHAGVGRVDAFEKLRQTEVADLDAATDQQQVLRLHVAVLDALGVQRVETTSRVTYQLQQFRVGYSRIAVLTPFRQIILKGALAEFQREDQHVAAPPDAGGADELRMAYRLHQFDGPLRGGAGVAFQTQELQRHIDAAGAARVPDLAAAAAAEPLDQVIIGNRTAVRLQSQHDGTETGIAVHRQRPVVFVAGRGGVERQRTILVAHDGFLLRDPHSFSPLAA